MLFSGLSYVDWRIRLERTEAQKSAIWGDDVSSPVNAAE